MADNLIDEADDMLEGADVTGEEPNETGESGAQRDPDSMDYEDNNVVIGGDASAAAKAMERLNTVQGIKEKRIANDKRTTTPYMTKYERARILGTRALQISSVENFSLLNAVESSCDC